MSPEAHYEPMSPVDIERRLRQIITDLTEAQQQLRLARDIEVKTGSDYQHARRVALLSDGCPKVRRDGATAADRDAFVDEHSAREAFDAAVATAAREAAQDHLRVLFTHSSVLQTLARSVQQAYSAAGVS